MEKSCGLRAVELQKSGWNLDFRLPQLLNFTEKGGLLQNIPGTSEAVLSFFFFLFFFFSTLKHDLTRRGKINIDKSRNIDYQLPQFPRNSSMASFDSFKRRYVTGSAN